MRVLLLATAMAVIGGSAVAEETGLPCGNYQKVADRLAQKHGEHPVATAIAGEGATLMVFFATQDGSTWTAVQVTPKAREACLMAAGTDWQAFKLRPEELGDGS
jgi:uncharacterized protein GlcG (DUF336 family)